MKPYMVKQTITIIPLILAIVGCTGQQAMNLPQSANTDYTRPLPEGKEALIQVPLEEWPDFGIAWQSRDLFLEDAIDNSISWFSLPSSKQWFPIGEITHTQAQDSVIELRTILTHSESQEVFITVSKQ